MSDDFLWFEGIPLPNKGLQTEILRKVHDEFVIKDEDVVTVTYPKSGTNWLIEILCLIHSKGDPKWIQSVPIWERSPWVESDIGYKMLSEKEGPRLISSHLPIQLFPKSAFTSKAKQVCVVGTRDSVLGDTCVAAPRTVLEFKGVEHFTGYIAMICHRMKSSFSVYNHPSMICSWHEVQSSKPGLIYGSWFDQIRGWMSMRGKENFLLLSYEELKKDTRGSVEKICQFLGKTLEPEELNLILKNSSFQAMGENKMSNYSLLRVYCVADNPQLLRKGISGDWKNHFTVAQSEAFDKLFQEKMADLPPELFPWE
ncbi:Sulfotransferase 2A1 [Saguinus oedipus]|uniref:Sulfotransferase n=1 Tax=Saguinus oedipus TaxID=9490 RepID=A0ABQ9TVJ8_SAGOE|nr:Sulfotransferase 2A1 [Saguinus oedipus]